MNCRNMWRPAIRWAFCGCLVFFYLVGASGRTQIHLSTNLGVAVQKSGTGCLYIHNSTLVPGSPLTVILLSPPQSTLKAEIVRPAASTTCSSEHASDTQLNAYEIRFLTEAPPAATPAIAVFGFSGRFHSHGQYVTADLEHHGKPESFRFCASSEGVHLTVWSGKPLEGERRWHQYYYLGYDVEANCTPAETDTSRQ